jgi:hypothetical protein
MCLFAKRLEKGRFVSYGLCQPSWTRVTARSGRTLKLQMIIDPHG